MKVLVIGANGYLGSRLFFDLRNKFDVLGTYHKNQFCINFVHLDITDSNQIQSVFETCKPEVIIQVANHASPRPALTDPEGYRKVNLKSTEKIVAEADSIGARLIFISSFAALNPDNIYGELKVKSEDYVRQAKAGYFILRSSVIYGYSPNTQNDRPFNRILQCIDNKRTAEFDTSWRFQPTYIGHISDMISTVIETNMYNHTLHVSCPSIQTQYSVAKDITKPFGTKITPIDQNMSLPLQEQSDIELRKLGLPTFSYEKMLDLIHNELRIRDTFTL